MAVVACVVTALPVDVVEVVVAGLDVDVDVAVEMAGVLVKLAVIHRGREVSFQEGLAPTKPTVD
jgi:hypothetical protein